MDSADPRGYVDMKIFIFLSFKLFLEGIILV